MRLSLLYRRRRALRLLRLLLLSVEVTLDDAVLAGVAVGNGLSLIVRHIRRLLVALASAQTFVLADIKGPGCSLCVVDKRTLADGRKNRRKLRAVVPGLSQRRLREASRSLVRVVGRLRCGG